jgi:Fe-S oxidoreductase
MHPEIGLDAAHVLGRAGLPVTLAPHVCCGRPLISQGLLDEARDLVARNLALLYPRASQGLPIVLLEPSCLSAIRDDMPDLLRGAQAERARVVARQAVLFESFLEHALADGRASLPLRQGPARISLHAHCHQRSMGLAGDAAALLRRIPGAAVTDLDAGCCGMAGSFGYTRGHFDVSQAIGERVLLPAARALGSGDVLVAAGTSCRHQVDDLAQADAVHPARLLRTLLQEP